MPLRTAGGLCGLVGGLAWLVRWVMSSNGVGPGAENAAYWVGTSLLTLAALAVGAGLVSRSAGWLRVVVAVCAALLAWSVVPVLHRLSGDAAVDGVLGALSVVAVVVSGAVRPPRRATAPGRPGTSRHAATADGSHRARSGSHAR